MSKFLLQHKLFGPTQNPPFWAPRKKFVCLVSWKRSEKGTHINFFEGILGWKKVANRPFSATKSLVYCFFRALGKERLFAFYSGIPHLKGYFREFRVVYLEWYFDMSWTCAALYKSLLGPSGGVLRGVSPKTGVSKGVSHGVFWGPFGPRAADKNIKICL